MSVIKDGYNESKMHDWVDKLESVTEPQKKWLTSSRPIVWLPYSYDKGHSCPFHSNKCHQHKTAIDGLGSLLWLHASA